MTTQKLSAAQIREKYLRFFERHGHTIVPSTSLVVADDPTLLFVNSGMVPFKDVFLGHEQRPYTRATTAQKCLRVSGKHNDLEEVGPSPRHQTFFEMLGNFSFGDYFKAEAIAMSWKLLTEEFQLPVERLWFTVFAGDDEVPADEEAERLWVAQGADPSRVLRFGRKDNFWVMGDTGPCGPCSEITIYIGDDLAKMRAEGVNSDDPDYVEIWNNVFMQYERATMKPLPKPSVDTGMGLERMAMALQGVHSTYETDVFVPIINTVIAALGSDEAHYRAHFAQYRAIADHSRAIAFLIADGVLPGNNGRSYVLRRILRRATYQGRSIGFTRPFMAEVIATVIDEMGHAYPQLVDRRAFILESADAEEQQFLKTLAGGISRLNTIIAQVQASGGAAVPGADAFVLKDTYGFPLDLTQRIAADAGLPVDEAGYEAAMAEQRGRSRAAAQFKRGGDADLWADKGLPSTEFLGYTATAASGTILALVAHGDDVSGAAAGAQVQVVLDRTPFYAESGGQVGDSGHLYGPAGAVRVEDTQRPAPGLTVHYGVVESGVVSAGEPVRAEVDAARRADVERNHTATHMLQRALRDVVGEHAAQAGSLVAPDRLRFDFTHNRAVEPAQLREIESRLNAWVRADGAVSWDVMDYQSAIDAGAIALFGEKYGDRVRLVTIDRGQGIGDRGQGTGDGPQSPPPAPFSTRDSRELCGGTHVGRTGEIGYVRVVGESSVGSGVRRIEALTGRGAEQWAEQQAELLRDLAARLGVPTSQVAERVELLIGEGKQRQQELDALRGKLARASIEGLLDTVDRSGPAPILAAEVQAEDTNRLREMGDWLRDKLGSGVVVLGAAIGDKPQILTMVTPDLVKQGYHAGNLVKALAQIVGGGGGGRPEMAQAGGRDLGKLADAIARAPALVAEQKK
ncbi:alanine--tRNA ligase [Oscillochloris sp. ZM17-4]|uniref:alanine--tRNA ligase n=1 Tax=Oscillochloris sp. ZM17-4 TaxID=2866714 RepID=UPI001C72DAF7|nr:alanine--tRNA ligase [Oscillochloris sp. ZM17-4]MBX0330966.1 alanine--tRNA ligase [Oscillochloris sp. ZM17-4]